MSATERLPIDMIDTAAHRGDAVGNVVQRRYAWRACALLAALFITHVCAFPTYGQYAVTSTSDDGTGAPNTLSAAIIAANGTPGPIDIQVASINITGSLRQLVATGPITITGNGAILNANNNQVFWISGGPVTIENLTIDNAETRGEDGEAGFGGGGGGLAGGAALYIEPFGNVTIEDVVFTNNSVVGGNGGAADSNATEGGDGGGFNTNGNSLNPGSIGTGGSSGPNGGGGTGDMGDGDDGTYGGGGAGAGPSGTTGGGDDGGGGFGGGPGVGGGGGRGLGGAVFVGNNATLTVLSSSPTTIIDGTNTAAGGMGVNGGANGNGAGGGMYVGIGTNAVFNTNGSDINISGNIFSNGHVTVSGNGTGIVNLIGGTTVHSPDFSTGVTINANNVLNGTADTLSAPSNAPIAVNGIMRFTQSTTGNFIGTVTGSGTIELAGTGRVIFRQNTNPQAGTLSSSISNTITVNSGTLQSDTSTILGTVNNFSNFDIQQSTNGTFTGTIAQNGTVTKSGSGVVTMGNQAYTGATNVTQGTLVVNGTNTSSTVTVSAGATFGGNSILSGNFVNNGTLAPGNSIGTTTVGGNFTANAGSTQQVEIIPATNPTTPGVHNDFIDVTGTATVNGGTVSVLGGGASFSSGTSYTFLDAAGGLTVNTQFAFTDDLAFFDVQPFFNANAYGFTILRDTSGFTNAAQTPNQQAVAEYLNQTSTGATGDYNNVLDQIASLSAAQLPGVFDQIAGSVYVTGASTAVQHATSTMLTLRRLTRSDTLGQPDVGGTAPLVYGDSEETGVRFVSLKSTDGTRIVPVLRFENRGRRPWNGFSAGYGTWNNGLATFGNFGAGGTLTSVFRDLYLGIRVGAFAAYNYTQLELGVPGQRLTDNNFSTGGYLRCEDDDFYFLYANSFGSDSYTGRRNINFGTINRTATSDYGGWQTTQYLELGNKEVGWPMDIEPFVGLQYIYLQQDAFTESGADSLNLSVEDIEFDSLRGVIGTRFAQQQGSFRPEMRLIYLYDFMGSTPVMSSTLVGAGGAGFQTLGLDLGRSWGVLGGGFSWALTDRLSFAANYDALFNNQSAFHMGSASVQIYW